MTPVTWNREISRLVLQRCASCHRPDGTAFSLLTYRDAQPRANEIKDAVLSRRMPPWGAVKGFGSFRNDLSLSQEQIETIARWVDGGIRRGNGPLQLPKPRRSPLPLLPMIPRRPRRSQDRSHWEGPSLSTACSPNEFRRGSRCASSPSFQGALCSLSCGCTTSTPDFVIRSSSDESWTYRLEPSSRVFPPLRQSAC